MNFRRDTPDETPEINLVPLIDVLLVILIFLAATTTFSHYTQLEISLPQASAEARPEEAIRVAIDREGAFAVDGRLLAGNTVHDIAQALVSARRDGSLRPVEINADAHAAHASVIRAMEAARMAGLERIHFATQSPS